MHFPSDLTKLLPNYVFLDCIKISEKKIYEIVIVKLHGLFVFTYLRNQLLSNKSNFMSIDMLHQIFRNKIYLENKM